MEKNYNDSNFHSSLLGQLPFTRPRALTRVRTISNLVIEPMSYERLGSLKKTSNYKYRILEEARLTNLNEVTLSKIQNDIVHHYNGLYLCSCR